MTITELQHLEALTVSIDQKVAHVQLCRPDELNSMNSAFWRELPLVIDAIDREAAARVIVLSSTGKHFSAGMDLAVFKTAGLQVEAELGRKQENMRRKVLQLQEVFNQLEKTRIPVLAAIQGGCIGGAVDMIAASDSRYCTADAFFQIAEINVGMVADLGTLQRLPRLIPAGLARELVYTGRRMSAEQAKGCGLVNEIYENQAEMLDGVMDIARQIASQSPLAVTGCKEMMNYSRDHTIADSLNYIAAWQSGMFQPQNDMKEVFTARVEKREPIFDELCKITPPVE